MPDIPSKLYYSSTIMTFYRLCCIYMFLLSASQWVFFLQVLYTSDTGECSQRGMAILRKKKKKKKNTKKSLAQPSIDCAALAMDSHALQIIHGYRFMLAL